MKTFVSAGMRRRRVAYALAAACLTGLAGWAMQAAQGSPAATPSPASAAVVSLGEAGMRVAIDPETGTVGMPSAEQMKAIEDALSHSDEGLVPVVHADGHVSLELQGRFQCMSVAHKDADGTLHTTCAEDAAGARAALAGQPAARDAAGLEVK